MCHAHIYVDLQTGCPEQSAIPIMKGMEKIK